MLQTWNLLVYVARFAKEKYYFMENFGENCSEKKGTKLKYLITAWLHSNNPIQRKHARRKLVFTVALLLKGNRSSFSKQLGINCTCEQIGLFLISTCGCGSHLWKLLKSPICSRVQLIPNCFSNRPISYTKQNFLLTKKWGKSISYKFECFCKMCHQILLLLALPLSVQWFQMPIEGLSFVKTPATFGINKCTGFT